VIVDTSVLIAFLLQEPEAPLIANALADSPVRRVPASCLLEASMILLGRGGENAVGDLDLFIARYRMEIVPFTESQARLARDAFRRYGKGRHAAGLNFGDCMAYATAKETGEELLFKGTDFAQTDIVAASY
jgi:ribonuclease VapC